MKLNVWAFMCSFRSYSIIIRLLCIFLFKAVFIVATLLPAYITKVVFDEILPTLNLSLLTWIIAGLFSYALISFLFEYSLVYLSISTANVLSMKTGEFFIRAFLRKDILTYNKYQSGDLIYRCTQDVSKVIKNGFNIIIETPVQLLYLLVITIVLFNINSLLALVSLSIIILKCVYTLMISKKFNQLNLMVKEYEANHIDMLKSLIERFLFVKLNRLKSWEEARYAQSLNKTLSCNKELTLFRSLHGGITGILSMLQQMILIVLGAYLISKNYMTIGLLLSFTNIIQKINGPVNYLSTLLFSIKDLETSYERIEPFLQSKDSSVEELILTDDTETHIQISNLNFSLGKREIIANLNFDVFKGEKVAIIGESGIGKSTLCRLLAGLYKYEGKITIYPYLNDSRPIYAFILDHCSLYNGTFREMITYGTENTFTDHQIYDAMNKAELAKVLEHYHSNLDQQINLESLSHGEKQRLELARIILLKPQLIILDEATSGLDHKTELSVWEQLRDVCRDSTIIYTTHNWNLIKMEDRVLQLFSNTRIDECFEHLKGTVPVMK